MCKVRKGGRWWTTLAGYMGTDGNIRPVHDLVIDAIAHAPDLVTAKNGLMSSVYPEIRKQLERARGSKGFALFTEGAPISQIIVAGTNTDETTLRVGGLFTILRRIEPFELSTIWIECPSAQCSSGKLSLGAGPAGPVRELLKRPQPSWVEIGDTAAAHRLITEQISATPSLVAAPIDVLEMTRDSARWMSRDPKSLCSPL